MRSVFIVSAFSFFLWLPRDVAAEVFPGPVAAQLIEITDGDTLVVMTRQWPMTFTRISIRIAGIDAPEGRAQSAALKGTPRSPPKPLSRLFWVPEQEAA